MAGAIGERPALRWLEASSTASASVGIVVAGALIIGQEVIREPPGIPLQVSSVPRLFAVMIGFYLALAPIATRLARRDLDALPLRAGRREELAMSLGRIPRRFYVIWTASCLALHTAIVLSFGLPRDYSDPAVSFSKVGYAFAIGWVHILGFAYFTALTLHHSATFRRLGYEVERVDLLDHRPLAPFVHLSMRQTLLLAVLTAFTYAFHIDWQGDRSLAPQMIALTPLWLGIGTALFLLPLWGVHGRLLAERTAELERVQAALHGDDTSLHDSAIVRGGESLSTVELLAYRAQVESFGTWPFDASVIARLVLYLGIPLASWIGAALVERLLGVVLD